jgi:hypothetical protein
MEIFILGTGKFSPNRRNLGITLSLFGTSGLNN